MNKNKILSIAQSKCEDERYKAISAKGTLISLVITMGIVLFVLIFKAIKGVNVADMGLIISSQIVGYSVYQYIRLPEKKIFLIIISISSIFLIVTLIVFIASFGVA